MVWFKVDDGLHKNRKIRKVLAEDPAALGLWTAAGSWSSDEGTDGFIPDDQLDWLLPKDGEKLAQVLVNARLWKRVRGGYQFHQWAEDGDGTKRNPLRAEVEAERLKKANAGRLGGLASGQKRATSDQRTGNERPTKTPRAVNKHGGNEHAERDDNRGDPAATSTQTRSKPEARASAPAKHMLSDPLNPRPDPTRPDLKGGSSKRDGYVARDPGPQPPSKCDQHIDDPDPPLCGRCADRRRTREAWDAEQLLADQLARSQAAKQRAENAALAIEACDRCDHLGKLGNGLGCNHRPEYSPGAAAAARNVARAAARRPDQRTTPDLDQALAEVIPIHQEGPA